MAVFSRRQKKKEINSEHLHRSHRDQTNFATLEELEINKNSEVLCRDQKQVRK